MGPEERTCQNCKSQFTVELEDFAFYEKMKVPAPTWCSDCRAQRRLTWRNERGLYKRKCNTPGHNEDLISAHAPDSGFTVYDQTYWRGGDWDATEYGQEYDFSRPFFTQFAELVKKVPQPALSNNKSQNSEFCNSVSGMKNCYLVFAAADCEDTRYAAKLYKCRDSQDMLVASNNELCYEVISCHGSYKLLHSMKSDNCSDSYFLYDCKNCSHCFGCSNLSRKSYHIFNKPYSKEEYEKKLQEFNLGSAAAVAALQEQFYQEIYLKAIHKYAQIANSENVTGDTILNSSDLRLCFDIQGDCEDGRYAVHGLGGKDVQDVYGFFKVERLYEAVDTDVGQNIIGTFTTEASHDLRYCFNCHTSSNLFGCVGLRNKTYCILNKQYSREEYEALVPKIVEHMSQQPFQDNKGREYRYGDYLPPEISPFAYNETIAQEYFPLAKEAVEAKGFSWRDSAKKGASASFTSNNLPDAIQDVNDDILEKVIACAHDEQCAEQCLGVFKVTAQELQFYRQVNIPLPRLCSNCRHYQRLKQRNPLKLWHRQCMCDYQAYKNSTKHIHHANGQCPNEFETSYSPERKEVVYCEQCYQAEVA